MFVSGDNPVEPLDAFRDLLPTLASGLDVRDIFQQLSIVASRIVPHDEANLAVLTGDDQIRLYVSRRSQPMPFYYRNADGDELMFVHRGRGTIQTDFGPLEFEPGDYLVLPRAVQVVAV